MNTRPFRRIALPMSGDCPAHVAGGHNTHSEAGGRRFCEFCNHELYEARAIRPAQITEDFQLLADVAKALRAVVGTESADNMLAATQRIKAYMAAHDLLPQTGLKVTADV